MSFHFHFPTKLVVTFTFPTRASFFAHWHLPICQHQINLITFNLYLLHLQLTKTGSSFPLVPHPRAKTLPHYQIRKSISIFNYKFTKTGSCFPLLPHPRAKTLASLQRSTSAAFTRLPWLDPTCRWAETEKDKDKEWQMQRKTTTNKKRRKDKESQVFFKTDS